MNMYWDTDLLLHQKNKTKHRNPNSLGPQAWEFLTVSFSSSYINELAEQSQTINTWISQKYLSLEQVFCNQDWALHC